VMNRLNAEEKSVHELSNPLYGLRGYSDSEDSEWNPDAEAHVNVDKYKRWRHETRAAHADSISSLA